MKIASPEHEALAAAYALGSLDSAVFRSPVKALWLERAAIIGVAECLALAGQALTPAELFRVSVGLSDARFVHGLDRGLLSAIVETALPALLPGSYSLRLFGPLARASGLYVGSPWADTSRPEAGLASRLITALQVPRADVGTTLYRLAEQVMTALSLTHSNADGAWNGWLAAALLPTTLAGCGLTTSPLPCLTGLRRSLRYTTASLADIQHLLFTTLASQAQAGLALLRRLEACAAAWRQRLSGTTTRSRAGAGAGLFLVWPALTRAQFAAALGVSPAGASKVLDGLTARDIVTATRFGTRTFYVAVESLGDFKLAPRQGRAIQAPPLQPLLTAFDDALAAFDLLGLDLGGDADPAATCF